MFTQTVQKTAKTAGTTPNSISHPPLPSDGVAVFDCLAGRTYMLGSASLIFGSDSKCDVQLGSYGFSGGSIKLSRAEGRIQFAVTAGNPVMQLNGTVFKGGLLPKIEECSLVIDQVAFFLIKIGAASTAWAQKLESNHKKSWSISIFESESEFSMWKEIDCPTDYSKMLMMSSMSILDVVDEVGRRTWGEQVGVVYRDDARAGFFATQFKTLSKPSDLPDAGNHRCPRCWMRFNTTSILAIHPSELHDEVLGESELQRFLPRKFGVNGVPLTLDGVPCSRLACPHCRGELPPNLIEKAPHMLSIVGDSMAGKSYFLTVAVRQLKKLLPGKLQINFTDADPAGNDVLSKMIAKLFNPSQNPEDTVLEKTALAGSTYRQFRRYGAMVSLPKPFTYNLVSKSRGSSTIVLYDNAGEHFRPGVAERDKSNATEHLAWTSGILFLFDPLQHRDLLVLMSDEMDPQVKMMKESGLRFDQDVILAEIADRLRAWHQLSMGQTSDVPLAFVVGKHDLLTNLLPIDKLALDVCPDGTLSSMAMQSNSEATRSFLLNYCPDIVGAAENISDHVMYFPASAFGSPAIELAGTHNEKFLFGPDTKKLQPYLVEAPFLWMLSQAEPLLFGKNQ